MEVSVGGVRAAHGSDLPVRFRGLPMVDLASLITGPSFRARCPFQLLDQLFTYVCLSV